MSSESITESFRKLGKQEKKRLLKKLRAEVEREPGRTKPSAPVKGGSEMDSSRSSVSSKSKRSTKATAKEQSRSVQSPARRGTLKPDAVRKAIKDLNAAKRR